MRYLLMIYTAESHYATLDADAMGELMGKYQTFSQNLEASGAFLAGERLQPVESATSVRVRDGQVAHTDGPFAETKEQLGGYYLIEAKDLDEALAWAKQVPSATYGTIEVRPIWEMEAPS